MAVFAYKAMETDATVISGTITADTPRQARDLLRQRGLTIRNVEERKPHQTSSFLRNRSLKRYESKVVVFIRELSTLLAVGIPLLEAIDTIVKQHSGAFRASLLFLRDQIASGISLAEAMRQQPMVFDELCVSLCEVGENAGTLDEVLNDLAQFKEKQKQLKGRIGAALLYPVIVLLVGIGVSIFLMTFVVPNLLESLTSANRELPIITKVVKSISDFLLYRWWIILSVLVSAVIVFTSIHATQRGKLAMHRLQLRVPVLGDLIRKQAIVRIAIVVATLMRSGIVFVRSIQIAQRSTGNLVLRNALVRCEKAVNAGQDIAEALEDTRAFPPTVLQIFAVGQQSGRLEEMLERLAADYDSQVSLAAAKLTSVIEPILIILLAVIVGAIAFATILPILEAGNAMV